MIYSRYTERKNTGKSYKIFENLNLAYAHRSTPIRKIFVGDIHRYLVEGKYNSAPKLNNAAINFHRYYFSPSFDKRLFNDKKRD